MYLIMEKELNVTVDIIITSTRMVDVTQESEKK
jgi:hypothetical protein